MNSDDVAFWSLGVRAMHFGSLSMDGWFLNFGSQMELEVTDGPGLTNGTQVSE